MPSPARIRSHGAPQRRVSGWLLAYERATPGVGGGDGATVMLSQEDEVQPDAMLFIEGPSGQSLENEEDYVIGPPELVIEIAASSIGKDLGEKFRLYQQSGVKEYVVWRVPDEEVDWFVLRNGQFELQALDAHGVHRSEVFMGLWLHVSALVHGDLDQLFATLNQGLATPEHAAFVRRLQGAAS